MKQPNILLILVDQMRADCTGYAGHPVVRTPSIDALAARGTWFANAFSTSPLCVPARAQLLTGRWGHETANRFHNDSWRYRESDPVADNGVIVDPQVATGPELLTLGGYATAAIGKCHYYPRLNPYGFTHRENGQATGRYMDEDDEYLAFLRNRGYEHLHMDSFGVPPDGYNAKRPNDSRTPRILPYVCDLPAELQFTRWCTDRSIEFLKRHQSPRPFFLQVGYHAPHDPYCVSPPYDKLYDVDDMRPPFGVSEAVQGQPSFQYSGDRYSKGSMIGELTEEEHRLNWAYYLANVTFIDEQVGRLLVQLDEQGLAENTIVIFTSDHGDHMGDHGLYGKSTFWEESIRVPLVIAGPGSDSSASGAGASPEVHGRGVSTDAGPRRSDDLVTLMDLFPTTLAVAGLEIPDDLRDAEPLLPRGAARSNHRRYIFGELGEGTNIRYMVRSRDFKYIVHPAQGAEELYDLAADPNELSNLLENPRDSHGVIRELRGELKRWIASADGHVHPLVPSMWPEE